MMKNSKLSKLLVAGVSVAMLTSALAPMAFAEESTPSISGYNYRVYVRPYTESGNTITQITSIPAAPSTSKWTSESDCYTYLFTAVDEDADNSPDLDSNGYANFNGASIATAEFKDILSNYDIVGWYFCDDSWNKKIEPLNQSDVTLADLSHDLNVTETDGTYSFSSDPYARIALIVKEKNKATLNLTVKDSSTLFASTATAAKISQSAALKVDGNDVTTKYTANTGNYTAVEIHDGQVVTLPKYIYTLDNSTTPSQNTKTVYEFDKFDIAANVGGKKVAELKGLGMGDTFELSDFDFTSYMTQNNIENMDGVAVTISIEASFENVTPKLVSLTVDKANPVTVKIGEDGKETTTGVASVIAANITGIDDKNTGLWNKTVTGKVLAYGETLTLPEVKVTKASGDKTVDDTKYTFLGWRVKTNDTNVLADGTTKAAGFEIANNVFDPTAFKATQKADETVITVVPVFEYKAAASTDVYTAVPAVKTPNDTGLKIYKNGKLVETNKTAEQYYEAVYGEAFKGGAFYNEEDKVFELYKTEKNFNGKWEKDTTATGIADGIYFENGVQDTKAYGLKKVVGDDSAFVYLVSDGVYKADYQGLWISEDKVWYKLDDGCCQGPANGVFKHTNGWYYNFKDGKMVETNGFELYGEDQYWFDAGECNTTGGARVAEHVDGFFYYVNNGIWDNTFNGELDGHTFVNGFAAE